MSPELQNLFNQLLPWGLTVGQTGIIVGGAVGLVILLSVLQVVFRIGGCLFRLGCGVIFLCALSASIALVIANLSK